MAASGLMCFLCVLGAGVGGGDSAIDEWRVADVVRYCGNGDFICKVDDVPKLAGLQVRVRTRGLLPAADPAKVKDIDQVVGADLSNAGRIILKHVRMRNYFRVEADVEVDGRSLAETLVNKGAAQREIAKAPAVDVAVRRPATAALSAAGPQHPLQFGSTRPTADMPRREATVTLGGTTNVSQIREDTTFEEALEIIRHAVDPPLPMVVMWKDIEENAFIERTTPVGIEGLGNTTLGQALKLVLLGVGAEGEPLEYVVDGGLITIASKAMGLGNRRYTRAYDAGEILAAPAGLSGMYGGGYGNMGGSGSMGMMGMGGMGNMGMMGTGNMGMFGNMGSMGNFGSSGRSSRSSASNRRPTGWGR